MKKMVSQLSIFAVSSWYILIFLSQGVGMMLPRPAWCHLSSPAPSDARAEFCLVQWALQQVCDVNYPLLLSSHFGAWFQLIIHFWGTRRIHVCWPCQVFLWLDHRSKLVKPPAPVQHPFWAGQTHCSCGGRQPHSKTSLKTLNSDHLAVEISIWRGSIPHVCELFFLNFHVCCFLGSISTFAAYINLYFCRWIVTFAVWIFTPFPFLLLKFHSWLFQVHFCWLVFVGQILFCSSIWIGLFLESDIFHG